MSKIKVSVFVDTNCFIHLRDVRDLPWPQVYPEADEIEVVVAQVVVEELDRLKVDRDKRKRDRSRAALKVIEAASREPGFRLKIRGEPIDLFVRLHQSRLNWDNLTQLDQAIADDRLVAAACNDALAARVVVFSFDTGPLIKARLVGIETIKAPENWMIPEQETLQDQEVSRLRRELDAVRATRPTLKVSFKGKSDLRPQLTWHVPSLKPLSEPLCRRLTKEALTRNPRKPLTLPNKSLARADAFADHNAALRQYDDAYSDFSEQVAKYFATLHERLARRRSAAEVEFTISNESAVTARNLHLNFEWSAGVLCIARSDLEGYVGGVDLPPPPDPPKTWQQKLSDQQRMGLLSFADSIPKDRDPTGFFWLDRPQADVSSAALTCSEFRAKETFTYELWFWPLSQLPSEHAIELYVTATNLSEPISANAVLQIERQATGWTDPDILGELDGWVADFIRQNVT